jgi:hypothetical protein
VGTRTGGEKVSERDDIIDDLRRRLELQTNYGIALQRLIEAYCHSQAVPEKVASECRHHADLLNRKQYVEVDNQEAQQ